MFKYFYRPVGILICYFSPLMIASVWGQEPQKKAIPPNIEPQAAQVLKQMSDYLKGLQQFSVQAEITEDFLFDSGQKIQYGRSVTAFVQRPNRLKVISEGDLSSGQLYYDGKTMTILDLNTNSYSTINVPAEIDSALIYAIQTYNLRAPLADLIYADAYQYLTSGVTSGYYLGLSKVGSQTCHHLAFRSQNIDWQIWVENDSTPLPCKLVITDKQEVQGLQFTALMTWNISPQLEDSSFSFVVPAQAQKVDLPATSQGTAPVEPKNTDN